MKAPLVIATRESPLALWQANWVKLQLEKAHPSLQVQLLGLTTQADRMPYLSLAEIGGKGLFVKELEEALLDGRADIAVHSMKDMPVDLPPGLLLGAICERENPVDAFVSNLYSSLDKVPANAVIGTSSLRRQSRLSAIRPDLKILPLRGNVNTRLTRLDQGDYSAIILAAAGLKRLGFEERIAQLLNTEYFLPAAGQGALGIECRIDDEATRTLISSLNHPTTFHCVTAERALCKRLGAGCQTPVGAFAEARQQGLFLRSCVGKVDGSLLLHAQEENPQGLTSLSQAEALGIVVAEALLSQGAEAILHGI